VAVVVVAAGARATERGPRAQGYVAAVYLPGSDQLVIHGGLDDSLRAVRDTWSFDLAEGSWTQVQSAERPPASEGPMAYDVESGRLIYFAGVSEALEPLAETWALDPDRRTWTRMDPKVGPPGLFGSRMVYDSRSDRAILFGGNTVRNTESDETWAYDVDADTWEQRKPPRSPPGRSFHSMTYEPTTGRVIACGGSIATVSDTGTFTSASDAAATWAYDDATQAWAPLRVSDDVGCHGPFGTIVALGDGTVLSYQGPDVWLLEQPYERWRRWQAGALPGPRYHAALTGLAPGAVGLYGGGAVSGEFSAELWRLETGSSSWRRLWPAREATRSAAPD
jgi:hypothetical protein